MKYDPFHSDYLENDRFILSKGHAAPILYAALAEAGSFPIADLKNLRSFSSPLEGHPVPRIPEIKIATGSLGQGLSGGLGMSFASKIDKRKNRIYVLLGDGEFAEGNVLEAMQTASHYNLGNLCAILDMNRLGQSEATMHEWDSTIYKKKAEAFGWNALPIDGHSIEALIEAFDKAKSLTGPTMIIAKTVKGKYGGSAENAEGFHGKPLPKNEIEEVKRNLKALIKPSEYSPKNFLDGTNNIQNPKDISVATEYTIGDLVATRTAFGNAIVKIGEADPSTIVLDGDVKGSSRTKSFFNKFPDRSIECYIAEQNMIGTALGIQSYGKQVICASFAAFLTRAHDQIRMGAYSRGNMVIAGSHTGVSIGKDGPSQMGLEDITMMRSIFGSAVFSPADAVSAEKCTALGANYKGIAYIRTIRGKTPVLYDNNEDFQPGGSKVLMESEHDHITIAATGYTVHQALAAAKELEKDHQIPARVIDCYSLKPVDEETLLKAAEETRIIVTVEDHYPEGGLMEIVSSAVSGFARVYPLAIFKMPHSGETEDLLSEQQIDQQSIVEKVKELISG